MRCLQACPPHKEEQGEVSPGMSSSYSFLDYSFSDLHGNGIVKFNSKRLLLNIVTAYIFFSMNVSAFCMNFFS